MAKDFLKRVMKGTPSVFFLNTAENAALKSLGDNKFEVKFRDGKTFVQDQQLSRLITDAIIQEEEITEEAFDKFGPLEENPFAEEGSAGKIPKEGKAQEFFSFARAQELKQRKDLVEEDRKAAEESDNALSKRMKS